MKKRRFLVLLLALLTVFCSIPLSASAGTVTAREAEVLYENKLDEIADMVGVEWTDVQKVLFLHDYLATHCMFDTTEDENYPYESYRGYGCLILRVAVCNGYALAYKDLCQRVGIDCELVISEPMNHAWNRVFVDGEWYHVDVTWDDALPDVQGNVFHDFFLLSDEELPKRSFGTDVHYGWEDDVSCTSTRFDRGGYWTDSKSAVLFDAEGNEYYVTSRNVSKSGYQMSKMTVTKRTESTGITEELTSVTGYWPVRNTYQYYTEPFMKLALLNGCLYFNSADTVYCHFLRTGEETSLSIDTKDGYLYGVAERDGILTCTLAETPNEGGTVYRVPTEEFLPESIRNALPFLDVSEDAYYAEAVGWAFRTGVTEGYDATHFGPDDTCTRAQVVTFLWRAAGSPAPALAEESFIDVDSSDWFYEPVLWALENNITEGYDETHFGASDNCSYAHILTFLWRTVGKPGDTGAEQTPEWYGDAMRWAEGEELLFRTVMPQEDCPRADVVYGIYRYAN